MATVASSGSKIRIRPAQGSGGAFNQIDAPVAASQTIKAGDFVSLSSGSVQQALALPGANNTATTSTGNLPMLGVALADITTNASAVDPSGRTSIPVAILDGNLEVTLMIWNSTASNSTQANLTLGTSYWIARVRNNSASEWYYAVSSASPTNGELRFVERSPETTSTEQYGLATVRAALSDTVRQG